jgi:glycosyltransferase involved in cell wall biosynthesis
MAEILGQTDIWVSASHTEGLGRMALEAMSSGCAVVLANTSAEFAQNEVNCLLFESKNIDDMVLAIDKLISDNTLRGNISAEGYRTATNLADSEEFTTNLNGVIEGLF